MSKALCISSLIKSLSSKFESALELDSDVLRQDNGLLSIVLVDAIDLIVVEVKQILRTPSLIGDKLRLNNSFPTEGFSCDLRRSFWWNFVWGTNAFAVIEHHRNARVDQRNKRISDILEHLDSRRDNIANQSVPLLNMLSGCWNEERFPLFQLVGCHHKLCLLYVEEKNNNDLTHQSWWLVAQ